MKLDPTDLRYLSNDEFRTLTATEMGSKNHEVVPVQLIAQISGLRSGGVNKCLGELAKRNLVARVVGIKYDGYRLTYGGYDFLAMRAFAKRDTVYSVGNQIGTGKESDIYVVANDQADTFCLKIHRLGRISFRTIKSKRDYLRKGQHASWMYMSRLAAMKEFAFMKVLYEHGFPVPKPVDQARHCIVMELIDAFPLRQVSDVGNPGNLYSELMDLIVRLAKSGLIHGDFNEFNILIREKEDEDGQKTAVPILIDFPQMVSTEHENAEYYFNRDVQCIRTFFKKRFRYESSVYPRFSSTIKDGKKDFELDVMVAASGFGKKEGEALERYMRMIQEAEEAETQDSESGEDEDEGSDQEVEEEERNQAAEHSEGGTEDASAGHDQDANSLDDRLQREVAQSSLSERPASESEEVQEAHPSEEQSDSEGSDSDSAPSLRSPSTKTSKPAVSGKDVKAIVTSSLEKQSRQGSRHHGKKAAHALGRKKGSKRRTDPRSAIRDSTQF